jgi:hypothetical protein
MHALVAELDGQLVCLVQHLFPRNTTRLEPSCYLQDLFMASPKPDSVRPDLAQVRVLPHESLGSEMHPDLARCTWLPTIRTPPSGIADGTALWGGHPPTLIEQLS